MTKKIGLYMGIYIFLILFFCFTKLGNIIFAQTKAVKILEIITKGYSLDEIIAIFVSEIKIE